MNESLQAFLNLLADLLATEIRQDSQTNGGKGNESCERPSTSSGRECSTTASEELGNVGPIPTFPKNSHPKYHKIPMDTQHSTGEQKGDHP
jgi:hypothetical protein